MGRARPARTADRVSVVAQRARSAGAPTASGPPGCSARAAYQPPWVAASKASNGRRPGAGRAVVDGGVHAAPRVQRGHRGVAAEGERDAGVGEAGERVGRQRPLDGRAARRTCRRRRPRPRRRRAARWRPSPRSRMRATSTASIISTCSSRCRHARTAAAPELGGHGARPRRAPGRPRRRRCTWKPAWIAGERARAHVVRPARRVEAQRAGGVGPVVVRAVAQRGRVRAEGAVAEQVAAGAGQAQFADDVQAAALGQLAPVAEHPRSRLARPRASSRAARSSAPETSGPAISCRLPMPSAAAASRVARWAARRWPAPTDAVGGLPGGVVGVEPQPAARVVAGQVGDAGHAVEQRRRHGGRVDVDPGQVGGAVRRRRRRGRRGSGRAARASRSRPSRCPARCRSGAGPTSRRPGERVSATLELEWRSRPVSASPVAVACTCASTKAGVSSAPSPAIVRSAGGASAASPSQAIRPSTTATARPGRSPTVTSVSSRSIRAIRESMRRRTPAFERYSSRASSAWPGV